MDVTIRRIGNSLGVIVPRPLLAAWGVGEGDKLAAGPAGIAPRHGTRNAQHALDVVKRSIAIEVVRRHSTGEIRERSLENLRRWKRRGVWPKAYEEWQRLLEKGDDGALLQAMLGTDERANRLRQSMPYAGMLPRDVVERLNEEAAR